jgi:Flp pilus assembly pilin Flp
MDHDLWKDASARDFAADEEGGAAVETAVLAVVVAIFAMTMRQFLAMPLLSVFTKAAQAVGQALSG